MFVHNKEMQFEVRVERPDPRFALLLQEQFGGENGELKAAMQYFTQAFILRRKNPQTPRRHCLGSYSGWSMPVTPATRRAYPGVTPATARIPRR